MASSNLDDFSFPIQEYQIKDNLGRGAFGVVSLYERRRKSWFDSSSSKEVPDRVAVKIFQPSDLADFAKGPHIKDVRKFFWDF